MPIYDALTSPGDDIDFKIGICMSSLEKNSNFLHSVTTSMLMNGIKPKYTFIIS